MLTPENIASSRLQNQQISQRHLTTVEQIVAWHGAMQAQEYTSVKWAIGLRLPGGTDAIVEAAIDAAAIVRTHILRPTWHFVAAADLRWMMRLSAPQIMTQAASRARELGLDAATFHRCNDLIARTLEGGKQRTRSELAEALQAGGVSVDSSRMVHLMMQAELDLVVCNGSRRGKEQTYALVDEHIPATAQPDREESLALLAHRYFSSHAPATLPDFIWWSGLKVGDARKALELIKTELRSLELAGISYWMPKGYELSPAAEHSAFLLPAFDEFLVSYKDRSASLDPAHTAHSITSNGIFKPVVVLDGRVAGVWSKTEKKSAVVIEPQLFKAIGPDEKKGMARAAAHFAKFMEKEVVLKA